MKQANNIPIYGYHDKEISYEEIAKMAFDLKTSEALSIHYRQVLINTKSILEDMETVTMERLIFLMDPKTQRVRIYLD
jgi:hypothetical protein